MKQSDYRKYFLFQKTALSLNLNTLPIPGQDYSIRARLRLPWAKPVTGILSSLKNEPSADELRLDTLMKY
jgi:hypothetical protein